MPYKISTIGRIKGYILNGLFMTIFDIIIIVIINYKKIPDVLSDGNALIKIIIIALLNNIKSK